MLRRLGADEYDILAVQNNIAKSYQALGRFKEASSIFRDVYSGELKLYGAEHSETLKSAINYAASLHNQKCFEEAKSTLRKILPAAQRVLGENHEVTLMMRSLYARALYKDDCATLDDVREAVTTVEDTARIARRVLGGAHPLTTEIEGALQNAREALHARETPSS